ncbi:unnamed protein product [Didymodactylos carnosus]|uniref:Uncharacterized protein n=1 Tax=Didymodactylos carnosus TaxID=1234261 RepID=A0A813PG57_9BILA|nr:unnamed protein product [Didymodactylos carnosus]CAF0864422.1 unnamed protein product [Didymodactylos carnosus]CAF3527503.1 unnamed protein product [Didymodactylos carnosus]CAF3649233.1 unnamed protein product [Didymodactylos carnosus]
MDLNILYQTSDSLPIVQIKQKTWLQKLHFKRRKADTAEEIAEIYELIENVYEAMDDQARAILLSLSKVVQDEEESVTTEQKLKAIISIGHSLCLAHLQVKKSTQLYAKLLFGLLSNQSLIMRLAAIIAIGEIAIDNLAFQMKLNEMNTIHKLFELMKESLQYAGRTVDDINEHSKVVAWTCWTIVNICTNCVPNILLLREIVPSEYETICEAAKMEIWRCIWRENYATTIARFGGKILHSTECAAPQPYKFDGAFEKPTDRQHIRRLSFSLEYRGCILL